MRKNSDLALHGEKLSLQMHPNPMASLHANPSSSGANSSSGVPPSGPPMVAPVGTPAQHMHTASSNSGNNLGNNTAGKSAKPPHIGLNGSYSTHPGTGMKVSGLTPDLHGLQVGSPASHTPGPSFGPSGGGTTPNWGAGGNPNASFTSLGAIAGK